MATLNKANPRVVEGHTATTKLLIKNGEAWDSGELLFTTSGALTAAATDAVNCKYFALTTQADPGNTTTYAEVGIITNDILFELNELDATSSSAAWIGNIYGIDVTSNVVCLDVGETSNAVFQVVDIASNYEPLKNSSTDTYPRVKVRMIQSVIDAAGS